MGTLLESLRKKLLELLSMTQSWRLYEEAKKALGQDLSIVAPDDVGCADALSTLIQRARPDLNFPRLISTRALYDYFERSTSFQPTDSPTYGDIILSVTGMGNGNIANGHTGIVGQYTAYDGTVWVMSNDSFSGTWEVNMTIGSWKRRYHDRGGMDVLYYELV